jgi:hypothetical protein
MEDWRVDCVRMLIEKGINLKIKNNLGKNIWYLLMNGDRANRFEQHPNEKIIDLVRNAIVIST